MSNQVELELIGYDGSTVVIHPRGFRWLENSVASDMPTKSEIEEAGNWDRVFSYKNCGIAVLITNG